MANVINAQNGIVSTADSTSELNIQTGGVNAISIGSGQTVTISNFSIASLNLTTLTAASANITQLQSTSATITTLTGTSMNVTTATHASANITTLTGSSATVTNLFDNAGNVRDVPRSGTAKTSVYTLAITDIGEYIELGTGGAIDVPNGIFTTGSVISIFNNTTGARPISLTITTAYIGGTDADKASVSLATRGVATILFISNSVCVVTGNVS